MDFDKVRALFRAEVLKGGVRQVAEGWAMVSGSLLGSDPDAAIQSEIAYFSSLGRGFEWKVYSWDTPPDLGERLLRHGFVEGDEEAIMVFDLGQDLSPWHTAEEGYTVVKVSTEEHIEGYRTVESQLGKEGSFLNEVIDSLERDSTDSMAFVAYHVDRPVSIARLNCHAGSPFGGCYGGSTLPEFRRMGFYRALLLARAREAVRLGFRYLQVDSLPTSRPILERLGFEQIGSTWPFVWSPL